MSTVDFPTFLSHPTSSSARPEPPAPLTSDQEAALEKITTHFAVEGYALKPVDANAQCAEGPLGEVEMSFLSREQFLRFLRADRWDVPTAIKRAERCLAWRRFMGIDDIDGFAKQVEDEFKKLGGQNVLGYDKHSRPLIFMHPARKETPSTEVGLKHIFFTLERAIDLMPAGVEKVCFQIDMGGKRKHSTPLGMMRDFIGILQNNYPERLGMGILANLPWTLSSLITLALKFCDPLTRSKIVPCTGSTEGLKLMQSAIPVDQLQVEYGGEKDMKWNEEVGERYWSALLDIARERREVRLRRWREAGGGVGVSEEVWKREWTGLEAGTTSAAAAPAA